MTYFSKHMHFFNKKFSNERNEDSKKNKESFNSFS